MPGRIWRIPVAQYRGDLESYRSQLASTQDETVRARLESQIAEAEKQAALYEEALKRDILIYYNYNDPFETLALNEYIEYQFEIEALRDAPAGDVESAKRLKKAEEYLALLTSRRWTARSMPAISTCKTASFRTIPPSAMRKRPCSFPSTSCA